MSKSKDLDIRNLNELLQKENNQLRENIVKIQGVCEFLDNRVQVLTKSLMMAQLELSKSKDDLSNGCSKKGEEENS